jgi:hypothetical protein
MADSNFGTNDVGAPIQPCAATTPPPKYWVEIEMVGEDDKPIPFTQFKLTPPSGNNIKGYLDQNGWARVDGLTGGGACQISFPDLDKDAWDFVESVGARDGGAS